MRVMNHYFLQELHWGFKVGSKTRLRGYRLDCHFMIILIMMVLLWIKILFVIIQYFRPSLQLLTVITRKKQAFWNSNDMQRAPFTGMTPLLLAIYQICCQWESDSARWRTVKSTGSVAPHAGFQPSLKMGSQTSILSHGWWQSWSWLLEILSEVGMFHWQQERCWRLPDQGLVATAPGF